MKITEEMVERAAEGLHGMILVGDLHDADEMTQKAFRMDARWILEYAIGGEQNA